MHTMCSNVSQRMCTKALCLPYLSRGLSVFATVVAITWLPAGSMVLINPDELHTGSKAHEQGWRYRGFYPSNAQVSGVLAELDLGLHGMPAFTSSVVHDACLHRQFLALHQLFDQQASPLHLQSAWREAILQLFQRHARLPDGRVSGHEPRAVRHAKALLNSQLAIPPTLEQLAQAVGLSPFYFARVFRRATGLPPHTWLMQRRLEQARALLKSGCAPIHVAMQLGFADQSYLNRQFKQTYGVAPGQYRLACMGV